MDISDINIEDVLVLTKPVTPFYQMVNAETAAQLAIEDRWRVVAYPSSGGEGVQYAGPVNWLKSVYKTDHEMQIQEINDALDWLTDADYKCSAGSPPAVGLQHLSENLEQIQLRIEAFDTSKDNMDGMQTIGIDTVNYQAVLDRQVELTNAAEGFAQSIGGFMLQILQLTGDPDGCASDDLIRDNTYKDWDWSFAPEDVVSAESRLLVPEQ